MFKNRHRLPGTAPATLRALEPGEALPTELRITEYDVDGVVERDIKSIAELPSAGIADGKVRWIEFNGLADVEALRALGEKFNLHPLALEDVVNMGQRPKVESYENHLFIVAIMIYRDPDGRMCGEQVSMFLGSGFLITVQEEPRLDVFEPVRARIRAGRGYIRKLGPDYLAYALLDSIVDHIFPILEVLGEGLEALEDEMLEAPTRACVGKLHELRRTLVQLRRVIWPERDLLSALLHDSSGLFSDDTKVFLRDAYDHAVRIIDLIESFRDIAGGLLELYLSAVSQRTNEIMRVLTVISAIFIPLTFLVGVYGMNFEFMPELKTRYGYFVVLGFMATVALGQIWFFRRKGWL
jgi:magnesium transporter